MTPEQSNTLTKALLEKLFEIEAGIEVGASILVQPHIDGQQTANSIAIPGYDWSQIDSQLRAMCQSGLLSSGTYPYDSAGIGIMFNSLTPAGRRLLGR
jgi:hypothetical protein